MKDYRGKIFKDYSRRWNIEPRTAQAIFLIIDVSKSYSDTAKSLNQIGFKTNSRQLRYFYNKIVLTQQYGDSGKIGSKNYLNCVFRRI